jgi:cysteine desulfurase family protein (TIGR01976 family)
MTPTVDLSDYRKAFPALERGDERGPYVYADAPGGTQVPRSVIEAMAGYFETSNANAGGPFVTSEETGDAIAAARRAGADFFNCSPGEVVFGQNMTTLCFAMARSIARNVAPGEEIVVTRLDHDANISPWLTAAEDAKASVHWVDLRPEDCTLDLDNLEAVLSPKTRVIAFTLASNAVGSITAAAEVVRIARQTGAYVVADAVHLAQHRLLDVAALGVDLLFCSPYKFFGPHLGMMFGRKELLDELQPYKVRPAEDASPNRWETGTLSHEALAGLTAAVDYIAGIGRGAGTDGTRRAEVVAGFDAIAAHERELSGRFLEGIGSIPDLTLYGIGDLDRIDERTPTFALRLEGFTPRALGEELGRRGIFTWDGNYYALAVMERLGLEDSGGAVRIGFCHYNTLEEVDRVLAELRDIAGA